MTREGLPAFAEFLRGLARQRMPATRINTHMLNLDLHDLWRWALNNPDTISITEVAA